VTVDENPRAFGRAFLVHEVVRARDEDDAERRTCEADFARQAVLEGRAPALPGVAPGVAAGESVWVEHRAPRETRLTAVVRHPAYLVLSDAYYPGWTAAVDGRPAPIYSANLALRAVRLEPGRHRVEFRYRPGSFRAGLDLCGAGLLGLAGCAAWRWTPRRRRRPQGPAIG
jgi:hypothetical protein